MFLKNVRSAKIKIQKGWRSVDSFDSLLFYVLLCRSFYALLSFRLAGNVLQAGVRGGFRNFINVQMTAEMPKYKTTGMTPRLLLVAVI